MTWRLSLAHRPTNVTCIVKATHAVICVDVEAVASRFQHSKVWSIRDLNSRPIAHEASASTTQTDNVSLNGLNQLMLNILVLLPVLSWYCLRYYNFYFNATRWLNCLLLFPFAHFECCDKINLTWLSAIPFLYRKRYWISTIGWSTTWFNVTHQRPHPEEVQRKFSSSPTS